MPISIDLFGTFSLFFFFVCISPPTNFFSLCAPTPSWGGEKEHGTNLVMASGSEFQYFSEWMERNHHVVIERNMTPNGQSRSLMYFVNSQRNAGSRPRGE